MKLSFIVNWTQGDSRDLYKCVNSIMRVSDNNIEVYVSDFNKSYRKDEIQFLIEEFNISYHQCSDERKYNMIKNIVEHSKGEYFMFLDDTDFMSSNWLYAFTDVLNKDYDLILLRSLFISEREGIFKFNLSMSETMDRNVDKEEILRAFYLHGGEDRFLTQINNKCISRALMKDLLSVSDINSILDNSLFIYEIMNFSILSIAKKLHYVSKCDVIYGMKKEIKIYSQKPNFILENFKQFIDVVEQYRISTNIDITKDWIYNWYREYGNRICVYHEDEREVILENISSFIEENIYVKANTGYFESLTTKLEYGYEYLNQIKEYIASARCEYVGFDIFDTLIQRPFWEPTDLFVLLNDKYNQLVGKRTVIDFSLIRRNGEMGCRSYYNAIRPSNEDVTLDEIYNYISEYYGIDSELAEQLKKYEIFLEEKYCMSREIGKELYEWAKYCDKKIVIISDMYLSKETIVKILKRNGYKDFEKLYLSNDIGVSKYSGNLFGYVLTDLKIEDESKVCFIGDNYLVDYENSRKYGMVSYHVPKATDLFKGINGAIYSGEFYKKIYEPNGSIIDQGTSLKFIGIRCMLANVANRFFGNPFVSINRQSDFDADPRFIGYFCAGMFLFSEAKWLHQNSQRKKIETIHFVARDGFYVKEAYDRLSGIFDGAKSNYMYFSRKAVAPLFMKNPEGIYELFLPPHILNNTPESVIKLLHSVVRENIDCDYVLKNAGIIPQKKFGSLNEYYLFAKIFINEIYDSKAAEKYEIMLHDYFSEKISQGDAIYDVGYSGRMETALSKLLGYPVDSYYFHEHEPWALMRKESQGFNIDSFYSFKPCSAFVLREQIFTPNKPSCVGFERDNDGKINPIFGEYHTKYKEEYVLNVIQKWAIKFVDDMVEVFGEDLKQLFFNRFDACIPFEYYMHYAKSFDRKLMAAIEFEDEFGTNEVLSLYDYWTKEQEIYSLYGVKTKEREVIKYVQTDIGQLKKEVREQVYRDEKIFQDGLFVKFYRSVNNILPFGSRRRNMFRKIVNMFIK
ncbi:MAG: HAD-IA family hydrolase [Lachnospiraceae bacterium]|nr:HAD-IA family hydrolase [Lachnospiraceae bacterium]